MNTRRRLLQDVVRRLGGQGTGGLLFRGSAASLLLKTGGILLGLALQYVLAKKLGAEEYGVFVYVLSLVQVLVIAPRLGLDSGVLRFVASYTETEEWGALRGLLLRSFQIVGGLGAMLGLVTAGVLWVGRDHLNASLYRTGIAACALLPLLALLNVALFGLRSLKQIVASEVPQQVVLPMATMAGVLLSAVAMAVSAPEAMRIYAGAVGLGFLLALLLLWRSLPTPAHTARPLYRTRQWLRVSLPMLLSSGLGVVIARTDVILVGLLLGTQEAGIYALAARFAGALTFGLMATNSIAPAMISSLHTRGDTAGLQRVVTLACRLAIATTVCLALTIVPLRTLILKQFGAEFAGGASVLLILSVGQVINAMTGPVGYLLAMTGHQDVNMRINAVVALLNIALNFPALVLFGMPGAAVVTSGLIALQNLWRYWAVARALGIRSSAVSARTMSRLG